MGKPQKKAPAAAAEGKKGTGLSLYLGPLVGVSKKPHAKQQGGAQQLQAKKLVDNSGAPTIEGLKMQIEGALQELSAKIERSAGAVAGKVSEGEAAVHRQAKADHAKTCQVLQDSQAAMDLAAQQHAAASKQVSQAGRSAAAAVQGVAAAAAEGLKATAAKFEKDLAALRAKAGIKA
uniref:Uncharacterized protein n=1 Tax=Tetradesmus obliquus TaxID=3088 RepID=A0A383VG96_TETOB|eukprot:jgi/Sobl393_1/18444/SZX64221.1